MKKVFISIMLLAVVAIGSYMGYQKTMQGTIELFDLSVGNCEALANCEVFSGGQMIANCKGETEVCWRMGNLYCSGTKVN